MKEIAKGIVRGLYDRKCPNCGAVLKHNESGHYAPPCMGEPGFYTCEKKDAPAEEGEKK